MAATPFESVAGGGINLQNLVTGFGTKDAVYTTAAEARLTCPYIQIQDRDANGDIKGGTVDYFYVKNATYSSQFVMKPSPHVEKVTREGWCDANGDYVGGEVASASAQVIVLPGTAFWFKDPLADCDLCVAGQVVDKDAEELEPTVGKWNMICNPFPMAVNLNSDKFILEGATVADFTTAAEARQNCPYIQIQDRNPDGSIKGGTVDYFYVKNATYSSQFVMKPTPHAEKVAKEGWCDANGDYVGGEVASAKEPVAIPAGAGIWFKDPTSSCTIKWVK